MGTIARPIGRGPITSVVPVTYAATVTLNAMAGSTFRCTATGNLTLADITGGYDGQSITFMVKASGADQVLTVAGDAYTILSGKWWIGDLQYNLLDDEWVLTVRADSGETSVAGSVVPVSYAASVTLNATTGDIFRCVATGNLTLADVTGGYDGQSITFMVKASGADRVLTAAGDTYAISSGTWWIGDLQYNLSDNAWILDAD
jgi:hypothetical protein